MLKQGSRIELEGKGSVDTVVTGLDHTVGFFVHVYKGGKKIIERSTYEDMAGRGELVELIEEYAVETPKREKVTEAIFMDIDPAQKVSSVLGEIGEDYPQLRDRLRPVLLKTAEDHSLEYKIIHYNYKEGPPRAQMGLTAPPTNREVVAEGTARNATDLVGKRDISRHKGEWSGPGGADDGRRAFRISTKEDPKFSGGSYYELRVRKESGEKFTVDEIKEMREVFGAVTASTSTSDTLFNRLVKLGNSRPDLRDNIAPVLRHLKRQKQAQYGDFDNNDADSLEQAYADSNHYSDGPRDLDYEGDWMSFSKMVDKFRRALENTNGQYNSFDIYKLAGVIQSVTDPDLLDFQPGREGSPVIYVRPDSTQRDAIEAFRSLLLNTEEIAADEMSLEGGSGTWLDRVDREELKAMDLDRQILRLWWD